ncbi:MAG: cadherin-like beta sandwich domain-containing protein [Chloroflexi bacterium]|nr:cadherin-like beta sandwich domain-containing protein [Chloroflexota bacterium]
MCIAIALATLLALGGPWYAGTSASVVPTADGRSGVESSRQLSEAAPSTPDLTALAALYHATNGAEWIDNSNWLSDEPIETWFGVSIGVSGRVEALELPGNRLQGRIPIELSNLSFLRTLSLDSNQLSGSIPSEIGNLHRLRHLNLGNNLLDGFIPEGIFTLPELANLILHENRLSGTIAPAIGQALNLRYLNLYSNSLQEAIPTEIGALAKLEFLSLGLNQLSGPIPASVGDLRQLEGLHLQSNHFSGSIPASLGSLGKLRSLRLDQNRLTGPVPLRLGALVQLDWLRLGGNRLTGCLPADLAGFRGDDLATLQLDRCPFGLPDLDAHPGTLTPSFRSDRHEYFLGVGYDVGNVTLDLLAGSASVSVLGADGSALVDADSLLPGFQVVLNARDTLVRVRTVSADGSEAVDYRLVIRRGFPAALTVRDNRFVQVEGSPHLDHNIPDLEVTLGDQVFRADFRTQFEQTGGIDRWGYPISEVLVLEQNALTQFYQRGAVDFHETPGGWVLERRLAWDYVGGGLAGSVDLGVEAHVTNPFPGRLSGPWGHKVSNFAIDGTETGFADFYDRLGGEKSFGFAKTDAREDTNAPGTLHLDGLTPGFIRQYFQAAVFEYHPGDVASPVKLMLLGRSLRDRLVPHWESEPGFAPAVRLGRGIEYLPIIVGPDLGIRHVPAWFPSPPDRNHADAAAALTKLFQADSGIGAKAFGFPWIAGAIGDVELAALLKLQDAMRQDRAIADSIADQLAGMDVVTDTRQRRLADFLTGLAKNNPTAARAVADTFWFRDGLNRHESEFISILAEISSIDPWVAQRIARAPGIGDGIVGNELHLFQILGRIAEIDPVVGAKAAAFPWLGDGVDHRELDSLDSLSQIVRVDREFSRLVLGQPWMVDGIDYWDREILDGLHSLVLNQPDLTREFAAWTGGNRELADILEAINYLRRNAGAQYERLTAQEWFRDGLDELDRAYLVGLATANRIEPDLFAEFARQRHHLSASFVRPDGSQYSIWVFQNAPFAGEDPVRQARMAVRYTASFLGVQPVRDDLILLLLSPGTDVGYALPPLTIAGRPALIQLTGESLVDRRAIYQGASAWFIGFGPLWLREGHSQMVASLIREELGIERLDRRLRELGSLVGSSCHRGGDTQVEDLSALLYRAQRTPPCFSHLSELFMLELLDVMGLEAIGSALGNMIRLIHYEGHGPLQFTDVHDLLLAQTPPARRTEFSDVYRNRYGQPWRAPPLDATDHHGDDIIQATPIATGSLTRGFINHGQDADVFRIEVSARSQYAIRIVRAVPGLMRMIIFDASGQEVLRRTTKWPSRLAPKTDWVAPHTGEYFVALTSPSGQIGLYELEFAWIDRDLDDHADESDFATKVEIGEKVAGTLGHAGDLDFFRFSVEAGQTYRILVTNHWDSFSQMDLIGPDGLTQIYSRCSSSHGYFGATWDWVVAESGEYFAAYYNALGESVDYDIEVLPIADCRS